LAALEDAINANRIEINDNIVMLCKWFLAMVPFPHIDVTRVHPHILDTLDHRKMRVCLSSHELLYI
jgi:hypothetical protein